MILIILYDHDLKSNIGYIPTEEFSLSTGESYTYNDNTYSILNIKSCDFYDYELIVKEVVISKVK